MGVHAMQETHRQEMLTLTTAQKASVGGHAGLHDLANNVQQLNARCDQLAQAVTQSVEAVKKSERDWHHWFQKEHNEIHACMGKMYQKLVSLRTATKTSRSPSPMR